MSRPTGPFEVRHASVSNDRRDLRALKDLLEEAPRGDLRAQNARQNDR